MIYIGIDPDIQKSGVAVYNDKTGEIEINNLELPKLIDTIITYSSCELLVVIEKGEGNKSIFHKSKSKAITGAIGVKVGKNFQVTNDIEAFMIHLSINYEFFVPNKFTPKMNNKTVKALFNLKQKRTNEEQRDALRCITKYYKK